VRQAFFSITIAIASARGQGRMAHGMTCVVMNIILLFSNQHHHPSRVGLDRTASASSNSLLEDHPSRLRPFC
jgi:hypothetical protein